MGMRSMLLVFQILPQIKNDFFCLDITDNFKTDACSSSSFLSLSFSSSPEGTRKVKQVCSSLACSRFLGKGTTEKVTEGGIGGPLGPIPKSSNT